MSGWGLAIGAIAGGVIGAVGSNAAANTQANAQLNAANMQGNMYGNVAGLESPYNNAGMGALNQLMYGLGTPGYNTPGGSSSLALNPKTGAPYNLGYFQAYDQSINPNNPMGAMRDAQTQFNEYQAGNLGALGGSAGAIWGGAPPIMPGSGPTLGGMMSGGGTAPAAGQDAGIATNRIASLGGGTTNVGGAANPQNMNFQAGLAMGPGGSAAGNGLGAGSFTSGFSPADLYSNLSPGYQFQLQQGGQAVRNADTPGVGALSGPALKDLMSFNQGLASTSYQQAFNNWTTNQSNIFSRLSAIAGLGQNAASGTGTAGVQLGTGAAQAVAAAGGAQAGGIVGGTNALGGASSSIPLYMLLANQQNPGGGGGGTGFNPYLDSGYGNITGMSGAGAGGGGE